MMRLELVSLSGIKYSGDVYEVIIPTADGEIAVYPGHMPLVSLAIPGLLSIRATKSDPQEQFATTGGVIEVSGETVRILVDDAEKADEILEAEAQKAFELAKKMKSEAKNAVELEKAQSLMDRHAVRLKVAELHRHRRNRI